MTDNAESDAGVYERIVDVLSEHRVVECPPNESGRYACAAMECDYETWDWTAIEEHYAEVILPILARPTTPADSKGVSDE